MSAHFKRTLCCSRVGGLAGALCNAFARVYTLACLPAALSAVCMHMRTHARRNWKSIVIYGASLSDVAAGDCSECVSLVFMNFSVAEGSTGACPIICCVCFCERLHFEIWFVVCVSTKLCILFLSTLQKGRHQCNISRAERRRSVASAMSLRLPITRHTTSVAKIKCSSLAHSNHTIFVYLVFLILHMLDCVIDVPDWVHEKSCTHCSCTQSGWVCACTIESTNADYNNIYAMRRVVEATTQNTTVELPSNTYQHM